MFVPSPHQTKRKKLKHSDAPIDCGSGRGTQQRALLALRWPVGVCGWGDRIEVRNGCCWLCAGCSVADQALLVLLMRSPTPLPSRPTDNPDWPTQAACEAGATIPSRRLDQSGAGRCGYGPQIRPVSNETKVSSRRVASVTSGVLGDKKRRRTTTVPRSRSAQHSLLYSKTQFPCFLSLFLSLLSCYRQRFHLHPHTVSSSTTMILQGLLPLRLVREPLQHRHARREASLYISVKSAFAED